MEHLGEPFDYHAMMELKARGDLDLGVLCPGSKEVRRPPSSC